MYQTGNFLPHLPQSTKIPYIRVGGFLLPHLPQPKNAMSNCGTLCKGKQPHYHMLPQIHAQSVVDIFAPTMRKQTQVW
jgi:hypothetical protein